MVGETLHHVAQSSQTACDATAQPCSDGDTHTSEITTSSPCTCPHHTIPTPKPNTIPFPATENNRMKLQQWLLDYYQTSTFNTCEHQLLPLMESVPMRLMVGPKAEPVAHHTPIPVPLHWQEESRQDSTRMYRWVSLNQRR